MSGVVMGVSCLLCQSEVHAGMSFGIEQVVQDFRVYFVLQHL